MVPGPSRRIIRWHYALLSLAVATVLEICHMIQCVCVSLKVSSDDHVIDHVEWPSYSISPYDLVVLVWPMVYHLVEHILF